MLARSLMLIAPYRLEWIEEALPPAGPDQVLIETTSDAVSIGTELPHYRGGSRGAHSDAYPRMTGYESVGRVLEVGTGVRRVRPGERVFSFYGHSSHAVIAEDKVVSVPDGVSDAIALLGILSCDVGKGVRTVRPTPDEAVLVTGAGTIGLLTTWTLAARWTPHITVVDPDPARRDLALALGARHAYAPEDVPEADYAVGIECSSRDAAFAALQAHLRPQGRICILADGNLEPLVLTPRFHAKELTITGSSDGDDYHGHAAWFFEAARSDADVLERLFQLSVNADELPRVFADMAAGAVAPVKVLVEWSEWTVDSGQ